MGMEAVSAVFFQFTANVLAAHFGQHQIEDDQVRAVFARRVQRFQAVGSDEDMEARAVKFVADKVHDIGFVIDDQHGVLHKFPGTRKRHHAGSQKLASNDFVTKRNSGRARQEINHLNRRARTRITLTFQLRPGGRDGVQKYFRAFFRSVMSGCRKDYCPSSKAMNVADARR